MNPAETEPSDVGAPLSQSAKNPLIDDATAADYWKSIETVSGQERERRLDALDRYADAKIEEEKAVQWDHLERIYSDLPTMGGWWAETEDGHPWDDDDKAEIANRQFIANQIGRTVDQLGPSYPMWRDRWLFEQYGKKGLSEQQFYDLVSQDFKDQKETRQQVEKIPGQIVLALFDSLQTGQSVNVPEVVSRWKEENAERLKKLPLGWEKQVLQSAEGYHKQTESLLREYAPQLKSLYDHLSKVTGRNAAGAGESDPKNLSELQALVDDLASMPPDVRHYGYSALIMAAQQAGQEPKAFLEQFGESWGRNLNLIRSGVMNAREIDTEARVRLLESSKGKTVYQDRETGELVVDPAWDKSGLVVVTDEQRQKLLGEANRDLARLDIYRELRDLADNRWDPIVKHNVGFRGFMEAAAYGTAQSSGYVAASMIPYAGPWLTMSAIASDEYDRQRIAGMEPGNARLIAGISAPIQTMFEVFPTRAAFGQLPVFESLMTKWANPALTGVIRRMAIRGGALVVGENAVEAMQDLTSPLVQDVVSALNEDVPSVDWDKELSQWRETRADTFAALLPMILIGAGGMALSESARMEQFEARKSMWLDIGFDEAQIEKIEAGKTLAEKQATAIAERQNRKPENIAAGIQRVQARLAEAQAAQENENEPTIVATKSTDAAGNEIEQYEVRAADGKLAYSTGDPEAAILAYAQVRTPSQIDSQTAMRELIGFYEEKARREGRGENTDAWIIESTPKTAQDALDRGEVGIEQLMERMALAGQEVGANPADVRIFGESISELKDGIFLGVRKFYEGAHPDTVIEEEAETNIKRALAEGRVYMAWLQDQVKQAQAVLGRELAHDTEQAAIESMSDLAVDYAHGRIGDEGLPAGVRAFLRQLMTMVRDMMERAIGLKKAFAEGKLSGDLEAFLADSVGLSMESRVDEGKAKAQGESVAPSITYSMGRKVSAGEYQAKVQAAIQEMDKAPEARFETAQRMRSKFVRSVAKHRAAIDALKAAGHGAADSDRDSLIQAAHDRRDADLSNIEASEAGELARARTPQEKNRIRFKYQAARRGARNAFAAKISKVMGRDIDRQSLVQVLGDFEAVLSALPPEIRGKIGGFRRMAEFKTERGWANYLSNRIEKIGKAFEQYLRRETRGRIESLLDRSQPKKGENRIQKSVLGPEAQADVDFITSVASISESDVQAKFVELEARMGEIEKAGKFELDKLAGLHRQWALLATFGGLKGKSAAELETALSTLQEIASEGRAEWKEQEQARKDETRSWIERVRDAIQRGPADPQTVNVARAKARKTFGKWYGRFLSMLDFSQQLEELGLDPKDATLREIDDLHRHARNRFEDSMMRLQLGYRADMVRLFGVKKYRQILPIIHRMETVNLPGVTFLKEETHPRTIAADAAKAVLDGHEAAVVHGLSASDLSELDALLAENEKRPEGRRLDQLTWDSVIHQGERLEVSMTEAEALNYLLSWAQSDVRAKMEAQGIDEQTIAEIKARVSPEGSALLGWLGDFYDAQYNRINAVYRRMYGMNLPKVEFYAPTAFDHAGAGKEVSGLFGDLAGQSGMMATFTKARSSHGLRLTQRSALQAFWQHASQSEYWVAYAENSRLMRGIFGNKELRDVIESSAGTKAMEILDKWIIVHEKNGIAAASASRDLDNGIRDLFRRYALMTLSYKVTTNLMNMTAAFGSMIEIGPIAWLAGVGKLPLGQLSARLGDVWHSATIQRRLVNGFSPEMRLALQETKENPSALLRLAESGLNLIGATDAVFTTLSAAIAYDYHYHQAIKSGIPEEMARGIAADQMDRTVAKTAQPSSAMDKSLIENNNNPFYGFAYLFASEMRQKAAISLLAAKRLADGRGSKLENLNRFAVAWMVLPVLAALLRSAYQSLWDDDEELTREELMMTAISGQSAGVLVYGQALDLAASLSMGEWYATRSNNPITSTIAGAAQEIRQGDLDPGNWEDWEDGMRAMQRMIKAAGIWNDQAAAVGALSNLAVEAARAADRMSEPAEPEQESR